MFFSLIGALSNVGYNFSAKLKTGLKRPMEDISIDGNGNGNNNH
jgi:hypothetical protein